MSLSTIDQSTGNPTLVAGNVNDKVGNLAALTTTDKSSLVGAVNEVKSGLIKVLPTQIELTTDSNGTVVSDPIGVLHPNKNILGVIINYNYQTNYGGNHATNVFYYPATDNGGDIRIANDTLTNTQITIFYTVLYTD